MLPELNTLCRTCMASGKTLVSIYEEKYDKSIPCVANMIGNITNTLPQQSDGLPGLVCLACCIEINKFHSFKIKCITSESTLKNILKQSELAEQTLLEPQDHSNDINIKIEGTSSTYVLNTVDEKIQEDCNINETNSSEVHIKEEAIFENYGNDNVSEPISYKMDYSNVSHMKLEDPCTSSYVISTIEEAVNEQLSEECEEKLPIVKEELTSDDESESDIDPNEPNADENNDSLELEVVEKQTKNKLQTKIKCPKCDKLYTHLARLKRHINTHKHGDGNPVFTCSICGKCYNRLFSLQRHMTSHKLKNNEYTLSKDDNTITAEIEPKITEEPNQINAVATEELINNDFKIIEAMRQCTRCRKILKDEEALAQHEKTHSKEKPHICSLCNKTFRKIHHLKIHLMNHKQIKPFKCEQCDQKFVRNSCLTRHLRTHTGDRPFSCEFCHKRFAHVYSLKVHKLVHTEERPYSCSICSLRFKFPGSLREHKRTHTGEKPFPCNFCPRKLSSKANQEIHMRTHEAYSARSALH